MSKDVIWTFTIQMAIMLCAFAVTKILSNRLSVDDFGQYNLIKRSIQVLSFVMLAGVGIALPRYIPLYKKGNEPKSIVPLLIATLIYIIGITLLICIICGILNKEMQSIILGEYGNNSLFIIAIAYAFVLAMAQFTFAYYRGTGNFKWYNGTQLTVQTAIILPLILFPFLTTKIVFTAWLIITAILVTIYLGREFAIKRMPHVTLTEVKSELNTVIRYSSGRLVADFFLFSLSAFPLIYISNSLGLQPTAYFSVGITFVTMVTPLYSFMGIILLPYVSESLANKDLQRANIFINKLTLAYLLSAIAIVAFIYVFINFLTSFFFSESYLMTSDLSRIMILSVLPQAIYLLYRNPIDAISVIPYNTIILGISLIAMIFAFSHFSSLVQLAWSYVAVSLLQGVLSWITWHIIKKPYQA
jgi:O-antigen/teichoic acid export membrane protein